MHELLSSENNVVYEIPAYQREYSWGKEQWDALFDDLLEDNMGHFLGTIICVNQSIDTTKQSVLELIDGQQRMTTISLLLLAVYKELSCRKDELDEYGLSDLNNLRRMLVLRNPVKQRLLLQRQNHNSSDFQYVLNEAGFDLDKPRVSHVGLRRIGRGLAHFTRRLHNYLDADITLDSELPEGPIAKLFDLLERVKQSMIVKLEVENHTDAFVLFESLNNRGLPLTPIDLIKTTLLSAADKHGGPGLDSAYSSWSTWLDELGDDYGTQERFFRHFYNAFKSQWQISVPNVPIATRTKLIKIYEELIRRDLTGLIEKLDSTTSVYSRLLGRRRDDTQFSEWDKALADLTRAQGAPGFMLLLFLGTNQARYGFSDIALAEVTRFLTNFFVRRNLTNTPPTQDLDRMFARIIERILDLEATEVPGVIRRELTAVSASDEQFTQQLVGPIYEENAGVTRFILVALAKKYMTRETEIDLWRQIPAGESKEIYVWTIEHILPQGENLPAEWIQMLGGKEEARRIQSEQVHRLGNLTISGFNSALGNKSFQEKRDRVDKEGRPIGYRNNLHMNATLANKDAWSESNIQVRTDELASEALTLFSLD